MNECKGGTEPDSEDHDKYVEEKIRGLRGKDRREARLALDLGHMLATVIRDVEADRIAAQLLTLHGPTEITCTLQGILRRFRAP